jgi:hypothetical protein
MLPRLAAILLATVAAAFAQSTGKWIQLFNGRDLTGWTPKITGYPAGENYANTFRVENGVLKVAYDGYKEFGNRFGHLFYKDSYSHYRIAVEYRFTGDQAPQGPGWAVRNSGIMVHGQPPGSMGLEQDFPVSIEVQLLGGLGNGKPRTTANLCTPGTNVVLDGALFTRHCLNSTSETYDGEQWVRVEVEVRGNESIRHIIGGKTVLEYTRPQLGGGNVKSAAPEWTREGVPLERGTISLQSESHPVEFRKVELMPLR